MQSGTPILVGTLAALYFISMSGSGDDVYTFGKDDMGTKWKIAVGEDGGLRSDIDVDDGHRVSKARIIDARTGAELGSELAIGEARPVALAACIDGKLQQSPKAYEWTITADGIRTQEYDGPRIEANSIPDLSATGFCL